MKSAFVLITTFLLTNIIVILQHIIFILCLSDAETGNELLELLGHDSGVASVSFSPDGTLLATGSLDSTARLWEGASLAWQ